MFRGLHFLWQKKKGGYILTHKIILYRSFVICNREHKIRNISLKQPFRDILIQNPSRLAIPSRALLPSSSSQRLYSFLTSLALIHSNGGNWRNGNRIAGISDYIIWFCCSSLPRIRMLCRCDPSKYASFDI